MQTSSKGINLIKEFEGLQLTAYMDPAGVPTIGYGHTKDVVMGTSISIEDAERFLQSDILWAEAAVNVWRFQYNFNQNQYDALVSFTYNCGEDSLWNLLKNGHRTIEEIAQALPLYCHDINGTKLDGLVRRRNAELELFNTPTSETPEKVYVTVMDVVRGIWNGDFGNNEERKENLYNYFQKLVNEGRPD